MDPTTPDPQKNLLAEVFDRASTTYGQVGAGYFTYFGQRLVDRAGLAAGMRVLDVATGRGAVLYPAAELVGPAGSVSGIDLSEGMVDATNAEIQRRGMTNATVQVMDAEHLAFADAMFDAVTCGFALFFMPDRTGALAEFHRVLRPGGWLNVSTWEPQNSAAENQRWHWYSELLKRYVPTLSGTHACHSLTQMDTAETLTARFAQAGFIDVVVHRETATFEYSSAEDWWRERWSLYHRLELESLTPEARAELEAEALDRAREMSARHELITELSVLFTLGKKPVD